MKKTIILALVAVIASLVVVWHPSQKKEAEVKDQAMAEMTTEKGDIVRLSTPQKNASITSPLLIKGEARGSWLFEADFPVFLVDWDGRIIAQGLARAQGEWMTSDYVPFEATLAFEKPTYKNNGALILKKDNPSDLPEHDDSIEIPILYQ